MTDRSTSPDVIIVLTDQHRADVCRREGYALDTTPFLDSLAGQGVWFDHAYTTSPLCCPARTSLLTGRWPSAHRVTQNAAADLAVYDTHVFAEARAAGYATAQLGKNHTFLGPADVDHFVDFMHGGRVEPSGDPAQAAFDGWLAGLRHRTVTEATPFDPELQNPHRIVDEALAWAHGVSVDQPLLMTVSFPEPHNPYQVPEPYFSMFPPDSLPPLRAGAEALAELPFSWRYLRRLGEAAFADYADVIDRARANYLGMLRLIDDQLARLFDGLAERHRTRPRLVVATADHGDFVGEYGLVRKGAEIADVLARIPLLVIGDAVVPGAGGASHPAHVSLADLMPTVVEAIGRPRPAGTQGRSLWPLLTGIGYPVAEFNSAYVEQGMGGLPYTESDVADPMPGLFGDGPGGAFRFDELNAVTQSGRRRKVRRGDWTLSADLVDGFRLYRLADDPAELVDRWHDTDAEAVAAREELVRELARWQLRVEDPLPLPERGYPRKSDPHGYLAPYVRTGEQTDRQLQGRSTELPDG